MLRTLFENVSGSEWSFGKTDLHCWIPILDRIDGIFGEIIQKYNLTEKVQEEDFEATDFELVSLSILCLRYLLETCSSRNLFNSYDRINALLRTSDLRILESVLELLIVPARKLDSHKTLRNSFKEHISLPVIEALTGYMLQSFDNPIAAQVSERQISRMQRKKDDELSILTNIRLMATFITIMMSPIILSADVPLFNWNPSIVIEIAQLIGYGPQVDEKVAGSAMLVLRSFLRYEGKLQEASNALRLSSPHGPISRILLEISRCISGNSPFPFSASYSTAFIDLFIHLAASHDLHPALLSSGTLTVLCKCVESIGPVHYKYGEKITVVLENLINKSTITLEPFLNMDGLHLLVRKIVSMVEPYDPASAAFLGSVLRVIERLLVTFATEDRMRNLVETALFDSLRIILNDFDKYSPEIQSHCIAIIAAFIHNEPTSLSILQERKVPQSMIEAICRGIPVNGDVISGLLLAFGASCLNTEGEQFFQAKNPIKALLSVFLDPKYSRALLQHGNSSIIGQSMDEFIRHHPSLAPLCIEEIITMVKSAPSTLMQVCGSSTILLENSSLSDPVKTMSSVPEATASKNDNPVLIILECICVFLEPIMLNEQHSSKLIQGGVVDALVSCLLCPNLGLDYPSRPSFHTMVHLFHRLSEVNFLTVLKASLDNAPLDDILKGLERVLKYKDRSLGLCNTSTEQDCILFGSLVGLTNLLAVLYDSCSMLISNSIIQNDQKTLDEENLTAKLGNVMQIILRCHHLFVGIEIEAPRPWFATAMQSPLPFTKSGVVTQESFSEFADPTDPRVTNLKLIVGVYRNLTLCGSLIFTSLYKLFSGSSSILPLVATTVVQYAEYTANAESSSIYPIQFLTFAVTIWNTILGEQAVISGYISPDSLVKLVDSLAFERLFTCLSNLVQSSNAANLQDEQIQSAWKSCFTLTIMTLSKITNPKSYRHHFMDDLQVAERTALAKCLSICAGFCSFVLSSDIPMDETGCRILITVIDHLVAKKSNDHKDDLSDLIYSISSGHFIFHDEQTHGHLKSFYTDVSSQLMDFTVRTLTKFPKIAVDFGHLLSKFPTILKISSLSTLSIDNRLTIMAVLLSYRNILEDEVLSEIVSLAFTAFDNGQNESIQIQAILCVQNALAHKGAPDVGPFVNRCMDSLTTCSSPSFVMALFSLVLSFVFFKKADIEVDRLMNLITANSSFFASTENAHNSIANLMSLLLRLCVERAERIEPDLMEMEMLERFFSWSFPQQTHIIDRFGPLLLRDRESGIDCFKKLFRFEGPGIVPIASESLRKQTDNSRLKLYQHKPTEWSQSLVKLFIGKIIESSGNELILLLALFSETIGAFEFLRGCILECNGLRMVLGKLLVSDDSNNKLVLDWTVQLLAMFILPPSAHISAFEKAESVAVFTRPIVETFIDILKSQSNPLKLKSVCEQITALLSISSADELASKMVSLTLAAQFIDQKAVVLLANALKTVGNDRDAKSMIISLMDLLARLSGRFKSKQKTSGHVDDKVSVADLEEAFNSSDMITDLDMVGDDEDMEQDDVDMEILEEEGALEDHDMDRQSLDMDEMEAYDEIIDTSDGEFSDDYSDGEDGDEDDQLSDEDDDSEYDDGYEITFEPEDEMTDMDSDFEEDEFVFEVDPSDMRNFDNTRALIDIFTEPNNPHRSHDFSSVHSEAAPEDSIVSNDEEHGGLPDYSSDFDDDYEDEDSDDEGDHDGFVDLHIDIPVTRRRSSGHSAFSHGSNMARNVLSSYTFAARAGRNAPQFNISSHPMLTSGPFMISGSAFDDRMRPIIEPRSETKGAVKPSEKSVLGMFEKPFYVSTIHRWEQLTIAVYGKHADACMQEIKTELEESMNKAKPEEKVFVPKEEHDVVLDSEDFSTEATSSAEPSSNNEEQNVVYEDPGIDPSFLSAVPFDMLEEVLDQYFAERRANIPPNASITINPAFLASLSPPVREMYTQMSAEDEETFDQMGHIQDYFDESDDQDITEDSEITSSSDSSESSEDKKELVFKPELPAVKESSLHLVDINAIGTIIDAYLSPLAVDKKVFFRLLTNLAKQPKTCGDVMGLLVYLLEESPSNQSQLEWAVENYLNRKRTLPGTPKAPPLSITGPKRSNPPSRPASAGPSFGSTHIVDPLRTGPSPVFYVQRILQLLTHLCLTCNTAKEYFMSKSERSWTIKRHGKSASFKTDTRFPVALLIAAFESPMIFGQSMLTEQLLRLLHTLLKTRSADLDATIELPGQLFHSFTKAIAACELSTRAVAYAIHIGQGLSHLQKVQLGFVTELVESTIKLSDLAKKHLSDLAKEANFEAIADPMSPHSKCLRVLKVLAAVVYSRPGIGDKDHEVTELSVDTPNEHILPETAAFIKQHFDIVCLNFAGVEGQLSLPLAEEDSNDEESLRRAAALLPCIECFFVCCRLLAVIRGEAHLEQLAKFAEKHRKVLNSLVRATPSLLTVGSLRILTRTSKFLDFDNKRLFFRHQLHRRAVSPEANLGTVQLNIRREHIFEDSYRLLMSKSADEVRFSKINVKFHGEDGVDAGGVTREWLQELSKQIFNPDYALFRTTAADRITYQPNRASAINPDHLQYFKFVGRIIGKALFDNRLLDCYFTRSFYKHMLAIPVDFKDLEAVDLDYYKSLNWMLENDITDLVEQTFSVDTDEFGVAKTVDLKPNGRDIMVTEENKREYVQLLVEYRLHLAIKPQIDAFLSGLYEIIPLAALKIFNEQELELLISGLPDIDIDDWRVHTEITGYLPSSPQIQWFWRCVRAMDVQERTQLIQFVTGTSKVPLEGFAKLQGQNGVQLFQIHRDYGAKDRLPSAHTCFNQLDLPEYESYEQLRDALMKAITECSTGFGLA